jgi:replication initiation and membrane attachment protein DnaB
MVRTQIQLTEEQSKTLKKIAGKKHLSVAELIRQGVSTLMKTGEVSMEERKERAIAAAGRFRSGKKDVSVRHDDYLAEAFGS